MTFGNFRKFNQGLQMEERQLLNCNSQPVTVLLKTLHDMDCHALSLIACSAVDELKARHREFKGINPNALYGNVSCKIVTVRHERHQQSD